MKNKKFAAVASVSLAALVAAGLTAAAVAGTASTYDPSQDPLVTKSYVDSYVNEKILNINKTVSESVASAVESELTKQLEELDVIDKIKSEVKDDIVNELYAEIYAEVYNKVEAEVLANISDISVSADTSYKLLCLDKGQRLIGVGCTEIIMREGAATIITVEDGLSDITAGKDLVSGDKAEFNHYFVIPKDDGRGLLITADSTYVLVRGDYEIR